MVQQFWHVLLCHFPDQFRFEVLIGMHHNVTSADDAGPWNFRVLNPESIIQLTGGFANNRNIPADRVHHDSFGGPFGSAGDYVLGDNAGSYPECASHKPAGLWPAWKLKEYCLGQDPIPDIRMDGFGLDEIDVDA